MRHFTDNLSREWQVLCAAARSPLDDLQSQRLVTLAASGINTAELTRLALRHGVAPLLAHQGYRHCPALLTEPLRQYVQRNAIRAEFLTQALLELLAAFADAGVPAAPFKGPVLAMMDYGALGLRDFCDLDVLVHPDHVAAAEGICAAHGFTRKRSLSQAREADVRRFKYDLALVRQGDGIVFELHWALTPDYAGITFERLPWWQHLQTATLNGQTLPMLAPEEMLLLLCLHGSKDGWDKLKLVCDVAQLLRATPELDWSRVWQAAEAVRAEQLVRIALRLADEVLDAPLPDALRAALRADSSLNKPLRYAYALLHHESAIEETVIARHAFFLQAQRHWWERLRYCVRYAFTPGSNEWRMIELPVWLSVGYRFLRVARLTKFYGLRWLKLGLKLGLKAGLSAGTSQKE